MKTFLPTLLPILFVLLFFNSCTSNVKEEIPCTAPEINAMVEKGRAIIAKKGNKDIWNLRTLTGAVVIHEAAFSTKGKKEYLAVCEGKAGGSAGSANHLLMKIVCDEEAENGWDVAWSAQGSPIEKKNIVDVNGDGISELILEGGSTWMGECSDYYQIISLSGNTKKTIYENYPFSRIGCGGLAEAMEFQKGDTLSAIYGVKFKDESLIETVEYQLYNGGHTDEDIDNQSQRVTITKQLQFTNGVYKETK